MAKDSMAKEIPAVIFARRGLCSPWAPGTALGEELERSPFGLQIAHSCFQVPDVFSALQVTTYCSGFSSVCRSLMKVGRNVKSDVQI